MCKKQTSVSHSSTESEVIEQIGIPVAKSTKNTFGARLFPTIWTSTSDVEYLEKAHSHVRRKLDRFKDRIIVMSTYTDIDWGQKWRIFVYRIRPHERGPSAPKFEDRSDEETLKQERCARRDSWEMAKSIHNLKEKDKTPFFSPSDFRCLQATSSTKQEER